MLKEEKNFFKDKYSMTLKENIFVVKRNLVDYIWKSANLEGIAVTFPQTQTIVDGIAVQGMRIDDINTVVNLKNAWEFTIENIEYPLDFRFVSQVNKIIGNNNLIIDSGKIRNTDVSMGGTTWKPKLPNKEEIEEQINIINGMENITDRAMTMMLYLMRTQPFYDGNKRTAMIVANQIMVQNGKGIISIPLEKQTTFREMLIDFYETNDMEKIKKFIYNNCIDGINFEKETSEEEKLIDGFIDENYTKICNNLGKEIIEVFEERFSLDSVFKEVRKKSINNSDEEIIKEAQNIFERDILNIKFETEEEFLDVFYEEAEKYFEEKIDNYDIQDVEDIFYEKIGFVKEDLILELIENKILNFEEKYQEYQKLLATKEKEETKSIEEEKKKDDFEY